MILPICAHTEQSRTASSVDILSGTLLLSHAPALLSGIFIPILQSTNRLWLAAAGAAGLHTRIRAGHHENCAANRNRTSCIQLHPGGSRVRVRQPGYKFRQLNVMQACYLKPSETRPSRDGYYGCHSEGDGLSVGWQWGGDEIKAGQTCWRLLIYSILVII